MNYKSLSDLSTDIISHLELIPKDIDLIVGIPRSGMLVANYLALLINKPFTDIDGLFDNRLFRSGHTKKTTHHVNSVSDCRKILIVDDSITSGDSLEETKKRIRDANYDMDIIYAVVYVTSQSKKMVDLYFDIVEQPRAFEWNLFSHPGVIPNTCFDIDGVLCVDPTPEQNDDGEQYIDFIENAPVKIIPTEKIGFIVSSRLEKYRKNTEKWLAANDIKYDFLYLLDSTAEERIANNLHAKYKAQVYKKTKAILFVESDENQAVEINKLTRKPVYCTANAKYYSGGSIFEKKIQAKWKISNGFRKLCKKILKPIIKRKHLNRK